VMPGTLAQRFDVGQEGLAGRVFAHWGVTHRDLLFGTYAEP